MKVLNILLQKNMGGLVFMIGLIVGREEKI
jgi:hypothetical protein